MEYSINLQNFQNREIYGLGDAFRGKSRSGQEISFTNYYMEKNGRPFFGVSGEFHFSRMSADRWEDELIKMKMGGINVVSTYVFWIHHEEEEGVFDFSGQRDLRRFVQLCQKHGLYVILRVGPFDHGEARNGGMPDWMYGKPFEVRKLSEGFLFYTRRLYTEIAGQVEGLFFQEDGPIIGVQIDNEYMHSSAPWELTTGISNEWVFGGDEGNAYMLRLRDLALECGLAPAFFTCTGWGGAATPDSMMPLWGGYAYRPWLFYSYKGEHPATEEYIYQDFHNNDVECTNDFKPGYRPEERPYACCEMGGGMMCSYYYRFQYPYKSVDAMANIKLASGCNFLGYYMFQGGTNPVGRTGTFMNEGQVPKLSYDYQAALGEFGQVRESYRRLKSIHYFLEAFGERVCPLQTMLPEGASDISPEDLQTLRYAVRTDGKQGFVFINNFQDHRQMPDRREEEIRLWLDGEEILYRFGIAGDENAILPFHFDMDGIDLVYATAQPVTLLDCGGKNTWVFMQPRGMQADFVFEEGTVIDGAPSCAYHCDAAGRAERFAVKKGGTEITVLLVDRRTADEMYRLQDGSLLFSEGAVLEDEGGIRLETTKAVNEVFAYPPEALGNAGNAVRQQESENVLGRYVLRAEEKHLEPLVRQVARGRYVVTLPENCLEGVKDVLLQLDYKGDIGHAFIDGRMISDNFANGATWEIGLKDFAAELKNAPVTIYITPLKKGVNVNVESAMAARIEEAQSYEGELEGAGMAPVYEIQI